MKSLAGKPTDTAMADTRDVARKLREKLVEAQSVPLANQGLRRPKSGKPPITAGRLQALGSRSD